MALQHLRSGTANKRPIPTAMSDGQLAVNTNLASPGLFFKDSNGDLVKAGPVHVGTTAPNASPASTAATALVSGTVYQILTIGTSDFTAVGASANTVGIVFTATGTTTGTGTVSGQQGVEKGEQWLDTTNSLYVMKVYDGTAWRVTDSISLANGSAAAPSLHFGSDTNTGLFRSAADELAVTTAGTQRVVVNSSGNVGIGTASPSLLGTNITTVEVKGGSATRSGGIRLSTSDDSQKAAFYVYDGAGIVGTETAHPLGFYTNNTQRMRIDSSGRVGIGTSAPSRTLDVTGTARVSSVLTIGSYIQGTTQLDLYGDSSSSSGVRLDSSGRVGIGTTSPSQKLQVTSGNILLDGTDQYIYLSNDSDQWLSANAASNYLRIGTANQERMRIDSSGRVEIGGILDVQGETIDLGNPFPSFSNGITPTIRFEVDDSSKLFTFKHLYSGDNLLKTVYAYGSNGHQWSIINDEKMRLDSSGRMLLGTTTEGAVNADNLTINDSGDAGITIRSGSANAGSLFFSDSTTGAGEYAGYLQYDQSSNYLAIGTNSAERIRIDSLGNVGIGDTSPNFKIDVNGDVGIREGNNLVWHDGNGIAAFRLRAESNNKLFFERASGNEAQMIIDDGNVGIGTTSPTSYANSQTTLVVEDSINPAICWSDTGQARDWWAVANGSNLSFNYADGGGAGSPSNITNVLSMTNAGNVGIGTTSPHSVLHLHQGTSGGTQMLFTNSTTSSSTSSGFEIGLGADEQGQFWLYENTFIRFATNNAERMRIDGSGRLLVGCTASRNNSVTNAHLQVEGVSADDGSMSLIRNGSGNPAYMMIGSSGGSTIGSLTATQGSQPLGQIVFTGADGSSMRPGAYITAKNDQSGNWSSGDCPTQLSFSTTSDGASSPTERMRISQSGLVSIPGVYSFTTAAAANVYVESAGQLSRATSSSKYKTNVETIEDVYADALLSCRPVWYRSTCANDNPDWGWWGFIAEEVAAIDPRLVHWKKSEVTYDENGSAISTPCDPEPEGVMYDRFVPHLLNLIKRQKEQIENLEQRLSDAGIA